MTIRMKKTGIFLLGCLLAVSLLLCGVLPLFEAHAKDGALTENEPFPAGFLEGTAELTVSYSAGKGFALNGKEFTSLYEGAFEVLPGNTYIALHVFTGSGAAAGVEITSVTESGRKADLGNWTNYAGEAGVITSESVKMSGVNLADATIVSAALSYDDLSVTLKVTGDASNLTKFSIQYGTAGSLYYANFQTSGDEQGIYISGAIPEEPAVPRDDFDPAGIFSNYATEKLLMRGQPYGVLIGNKAGVNAVWSDTIGYNTPVQMNSFRLKADVVGGSEWNNNRNIVLQAVGGDLVIREFGNGWGQILFQDKNISAGGGNVWVTSPDQSELDISVLIDGDTVTVKNNTNDTVLAESTEIRFSTASDGSVNDYSNLFFKFENVTVTDRTMGLLVKEINGEVFQGDEIDADISEWDYWDETKEPDYELYWRNEGAVPTCVKGGVAVRGADKGWQKYIYSDYGKSTLQGFDSISELRVELHAVRPDKIDGVDFVLKAAGGQMLAVRITDFGSLTTYGATVYSYTDNGFPVLGSVSDVPVDVRNRGLYVLEWDYDATRTLKINGVEIPVQSSAIYPNGYKDFTHFKSSNAQIAFGIFEDAQQYENSMVVLTSVNGKELPAYTAAPNVDYSENWRSDAAEISNAADGLRIAATKEGELQYAVYGNAADLSINTVKHNVKDFRISLRMEENATSAAVRLSGQTEDKRDLTILLRLTAESDGMLFEVLNSEQAVLARTKVAKAADGVYEIAFSANEKNASCNGIAAEGDLESAAFRFLNAKLSVGLAGGAGTYITVTALGGEDLKYYIAVPNYEREYGEGETIVDDFQLDEWMSAGVSVASSEKSVDFTFRSTEAGMWYEIPMSYTASALNQNSSKSYLSLYFSCNENITKDGGVRISLATRAGNLPGGAITSALSIRITDGGSTVSVYNAAWNSLSAAPTTIIGKFAADGGFLIEFDNATKTLYVNGTQIAGSFSSFNFPDNGTFVGIFGTGSESAPGVLSLKKVNGADLILGADNPMIEFGDPDEQRVQDQIRWVEKNGDPTMDYQQELTHSTEKVQKTITERVYVGQKLTALGVVLIVVGCAAVLGAGVAVVLIVRKKKKN